MNKARWMRWLPAGLVAVLTACGGAAPVEEAPVPAVVEPTATSVETPTAVAVVETPTEVPTDAPTQAPTEAATEAPTVAPTVAEPTATNTVEPTATAGPSPEQAALLEQMTPLGIPPEIENEIWLNSEPLKLRELEGQVVIVEFWTYG